LNRARQLYPGRFIAMKCNLEPYTDKAAPGELLYDLEPCGWQYVSGNHTAAGLSAAANVAFQYDPELIEFYAEDLIKYPSVVQSVAAQIP
jgi:hypothetical protein